MRRFLCLLSFAALATASQANLIVNGGFESNPAPNASYIQYVGGNSFPGWSVGGNDILVVDKNYVEPSVAFVSHLGNDSLDLTGAGNNGPTNSVSQSIATLVGQTYQVNFFVGRADGNANYVAQSSVALSIDGGVPQIFTNSAVTANSVNWKAFSTTFVATNVSTLLRFSNGTPITPANNFAGFDDVSVEAVPEPASLAAFAVGAVALLRRRRR